MEPTPRIGVVIATRDRRDALLRALRRLESLPERPPIVVVDNGSADGTPDAVRAAFPDVRVMEPGRNLGAGSRTVGARALDTPYVAFNDDDSWYAPGSLQRAAEVLDAHPRLALVAARVLVGRTERLDPVCEAMARSPVRAGPDVPGPAVLGFVACGAVVRRDAFLSVGGFDARYGIGGEERRLALDLAAAGWQLAYVDDVVVHHHPAQGGVRPGRVGQQVRNDLWSAWLRRPAGSAVRSTAAVLADAGRRAPLAAVRGLGRALAGTAWVARERRVVPRPVEQAARAIETAGD